MTWERDSNRAGDAFIPDRTLMTFLKDIVGMTTAVLAVAAIVIIGLSAVTFSMTSHHHIYNPFDQDFGFIDCLLFYVDQACKGGFFDVMEVFKLDVQDHLRVDAWRHVGFGCLLVGVRSMMSLFVIGTIFTVAQSYFYLRRISKAPAA
jgi:hypothetical protein